MSLRRQLLNGFLRRVEKPWLARVTDPALERRAFERAARYFRTPPYTCYLPDEVGGVPGDWAWVRPARPEIFLYIHGGAHLIGSPRTHRAMVARLAQMTRLRAFLPDYRLAPEHPFPASLEDARAVWQGLLARGYAAERIVLGGDSSGGGVMLALLADLLKTGERPAAAFAFSPWTDLTLSGESFVANAERDVLLPASQAKTVLGHFLAGQDPADPRASPLFAEFAGAPPIFLQAARTEILRDDTLRLADRMRHQGVQVTVDLWGHLPHVWPIFQGWLPEADEALRRLAEFIAATLRATRSGDS
ncbi:MAG: alpha/beta hydrolase [Rhodobacter sp.]|nr:alpha/beta hydrolase [Rhodobacter sp.]